MMTARDTFLDILERNRRGEAVGVYSICSANRDVIQAGMLQSIEDDSLVLVESTSNQVDQNGGYTGMKPADFVAYVRAIAAETGLEPSRLLFGGDHLGPNAWSSLTAENAMQNARLLVHEYAKAGYEKIHLDASMHLADDTDYDRSRPLPDDVVAHRAADLCQVVESTWKAFHSGTAPPVYVIGTEVPIPGGAQEAEDHVRVTPPAEAMRTIEITREEFGRRGLGDAWQRVCAVVVQPGVEFGDDQVFDYDRSTAAELSRSILAHPGFVFEAHSTDYQTEAGLRDLVRDHFCILKVGPWLTFAYREALFALAAIEAEIVPRGTAGSQLRERLERAMLDNPAYWGKYYPGSSEEQAFKRKYSYSDRSRYYWPVADLHAAKMQLYANLRERGIGLSVLSQFLPRQYQQVREGKIPLEPNALVLARVQDVMAIYARACGLSAGAPKPRRERRSVHR